VKDRPDFELNQSDCGFAVGTSKCSRGFVHEYVDLISYTYTMDLNA